MCFVIDYTHAACGHLKKSEIVEACQPAEIFEEDCTLIHLFSVRLMAPSLCVACFRDKEASIDDEYDSEVHTIRQEIAEYEAAQPDTQIRGRAEGSNDPYIAQLEQWIVDAKETRDRQIVWFRDMQGVWGDG
ncbi:hypothetical protein IMSHALPRED_006154 [Imshaugia aleurites]|uniref:Uncharacterized protein n=1 Tax=Imshaugia aleurites TaxID=172621 RepID=A0A8H3FH17_9LECA|nr:hypothetical protein IMSHALPRED_006154 [Imshaugia aleurites]